MLCAKVLGYLADALQDEPDDPEAAMGGLELHTLIQLCVLKRDRRRDELHVVEAARLYGDVAAAYRERGAPVGSHAGWHYFYPRSVYEAVCALRAGGGIQEE